GLARVDAGYPIEKIAVPVEIHSIIVSAAEEAGIGYPVDGEEALAQILGAASIGFHILIARIDGKPQAVRQREAGRAAHISGVRRVVAAVEFRSATAAVAILLRRAVDTTAACELAGRNRARKIDVVETL